jgi:hypothetical protein
MIEYGNKILNELHPHDKEKLNHVQTPSANAVREKRKSGYDKKQEKGA